MGRIINYIRNNWQLFAIGSFFLGLFAYLTYSGNQFCDCTKTESYRDGTTRSHSRAGFYRYYHK